MLAAPPLRNTRRREGLAQQIKGFKAATLLGPALRGAVEPHRHRDYILD